MITARPTARVATALVLALVGCQTAPRDAYTSGESAMARGDLPAALRGFDSVAISDLRYPEARLAAAGLERRLRRHQELLLQGLRRRGEWRDDEAIAAFRGALDAWPSSREAEQLLAATMQRRLMLATLPGRMVPVIAGAGLPKEPDDEVEFSAASPAKSEVSNGHPTATHVDAEPEVARVAVVGEQPAPSVASARDPIGEELAQIEGRLGAGAFEQVLSDLQALHRMAPGDARVASRLARLLQQRGLIRYGQGDVAQAIADLGRAVELDPAMPSARVLLELASRELATPPR